MKNKNKQTMASQYGYPALVIAIVLLLTILLKWRWLYLIITISLLFIRWIYNLPSPKLKAETIAFNKEWDANRKKMKEDYKEKKKLLGSEKQYVNFEAYWTKYIELGLDKLEKELKVGAFASTTVATKKEYTVKELLYDVFLGTTETEKKRSFSSTNNNGYNGESTSGQSSKDYGGGSSGGGGASS